MNQAETLRQQVIRQLEAMAEAGAFVPPAALDAAKTLPMAEHIGTPPEDVADFIIHFYAIPRPVSPEVAA